MERLKKLATIIIAMAMVITLIQPVSAMEIETLAKTGTLTQVNIIHSLSTESPVDGVRVPMIYYGWLWSEMPGTTLVSATSAEPLDGFDEDVEIPDTIWIGGLGEFYPFRKLANSLGYDVLWYTTTNEVTQKTQGYVMFTERVEGGVWIRVDPEYYKPAFISDWFPQRDYWHYASGKTENGYLVATRGLSLHADPVVVIEIPQEYVLEVKEEG